MILIYSKAQTERLKYITHHIFNRIWGIPFQICEDITDFENYQGYKLNYSDVFFENVISIRPHNLLFEQTITPQTIDIVMYKETPVCFQTKTLDEILPFDIFAASFYFLSRYEEYLPHQQDEFQRYMATESIASEHHFLHLAVVDRWIEILATALKNTYPDLVFADRTYSFIPTYDIDIAYAYLHRSFLLSAAGYIRYFSFKNFKQRTQVLLKKRQDPYDTFDYLSNLHKLNNLRPCYFFLVAKKHSRYDKNIHYKNPYFKELIQKLAENADIGLHTSYYAKDCPQKMDFELDFLQKTIQKLVVKNRHHYLRFSLPDTYNVLASKGIKEEYSMGYPQTVGFRAGTCNAFLFFDLQNNRTSEMEIYPLLFMENALSKLPSEEEIINYLLPYIEEVKRYKGVLVSLFHNQSFENEKWKKVYEKLLKYVL